MSLTLVQDTKEGLEQDTQRASIKDQPDTAGAARGADRTAASSERDQLIYVPAGTGRTYKSPIDQIRFLITGEQSGGALFMAEATVPPGCGNPPHIHDREGETFYLQQGTLTIHVGDKTLTASPGDFVQLPRGIVHCFQNTGNVDAKFLVVAAPAGLEKFFEEAFYPAADLPDTLPPMTDAFMARVLTAAPKCGLTFLPQARALTLLGEPSEAKKETHHAGNSCGPIGRFGFRGLPLISTRLQMASFRCSRRWDSVACIEALVGEWGKRVRLLEKSRSEAARH
jgi:quercetin dioxygenase-like cupin family protein